MKKEITHYNQPSFCLENDSVELYVTKTGAYATADFNVRSQKVSPFYLAPWWNEPRNYSAFNSEGMRGTWFCFPMGLNEPFHDISYPVHGFSVENDYSLQSYASEEDSSSMVLTADLPEDHAKIQRTFTLCKGENCIYTKDIILGATGKYPVGYHPTLRIPTTLGSAVLDFSDWTEGFTSPKHIENYMDGGYSSLVPGYLIKDLQKVPTVYGGNVDLSHQPFIRGFDDIFMMLSDTDHPFSYTTLSIPSEGYLYFQLKSPRNLASTMVWTSYCGRHYEPWNGRVNGCIGLEEISAYYYYGITAVQEDDPLARQGYHTFDTFNGFPREYRLIQGIVPIHSDFYGVSDIKKADKNHILICGKNGEELLVPCQAEFMEWDIDPAI